MGLSAVPFLSSDSRRRAPIAAPESLRRVLHAVLAAAAAPVRARAMLQVILARFPLAATGPVELDEQMLTRSASSPEAALLASEVWQQLSDNERLVTGLLDLPVREMAAETGLSRSTAARAATSAKQVLSAFLSDVEDPAEIVQAPATASAALRERGTMVALSAS